MVWNGKTGIVIYTHEIGEYWEKLVLEAGLDVLGLHPVGGLDAHQSLETFLQQTGTPEYQDFCARLREKGVQITLECHALSWLVPRHLFETHPDWFRMDENGQRTADFNLCAGNAEALDYLEERTAELARRIPADDDCYRLWIDDIRGKVCHCDHCRSLSAADQAMVLYNTMLRGLKRVNPRAKLAYLAYHDTMQPPTVQPEPGIFLEFAPIHRVFTHTIDDPASPENRAETENLEALLAYFGRENAQVLEYWMDNSLFCGWKLPYKALHLDEALLAHDAAWYKQLGFDFLTSFGCFLNRDYASQFGIPPVEAYGRILRSAV